MIVGGVKVIGSELVADNGVIHTIEQVILHPKKQSIVDILVENSDTYSTLITAVKAVDLVDTLSTGISTVLNKKSSFILTLAAFNCKVAPLPYLPQQMLHLMHYPREHWLNCWPHLKT